MGVEQLGSGLELRITILIKYAMAMTSKMMKVSLKRRKERRAGIVDQILEIY